MPCTGDDYGSYKFIALNAPDPGGRRTMADRLNDIINVKDRGAKGDNSTDDTLAIQNAINYAIGPRPDGTTGGIVFFPQGAYKINKPLTCGTTSATSIGVILRGCGKNGSIFSAAAGGYSDPNNYGFDLTGGTGGTTPPFTQDCIESVQGIGNLSIKLTRAGASVIDCIGGGIIGNTWLDATAASGVYIADCLLRGPGQVDANSLTFGAVRGTHAGTIGIAIGTGAVVGTRIQYGYEVAYALSGKGSACIGCSTEDCGIAVRVGWSPAGETQSFGAVIQGLQTERTMIHIDLYNATGCYVSGNELYAGEGTPNDMPISGFTYDIPSSRATATTMANHNLPVGTSRIQLPSGGAWTSTGAGLAGAIVATNVTPTTFSYPLAVNPGASNPGSWNWPPLSAIRARIAKECIITGNHVSVIASVASFDLDASGAASHQSNVVYGNAVEYGWLMPTNANNLASWKFLLSESSTTSTSSGGLNTYSDASVRYNPNGTMVFANLPGQSGVLQPGPFEGQEYDIKDGSKFGFTPPTAAIWNDQVIGGGNGHYKVRYNGTAWFRIG